MDQNTKLQAEYKATYTAFSGADIVATFDDNVVGELQAISYSVTREKSPIYTMGSPDPRSFARGKRGIAGSLVFTVFNKEALGDLMSKKKVSTNFANEEFRNRFNAYFQDYQARLNGGTPSTDGEYFGDVDAWEDFLEKSMTEGNGFFNSDGTDAQYADEIPPFNITITMKNEYGQAAAFSILGVEILNEGSGMSIDDITTEKACTFVARGITPLRPTESK